MPKHERYACASKNAVRHQCTWCAICQAASFLLLGAKTFSVAQDTTFRNFEQHVLRRSCEAGPAPAARGCCGEGRRTQVGSCAVARLCTSRCRPPWGRRIRDTPRLVPCCSCSMPEKAASTPMLHTTLMPLNHNHGQPTNPQRMLRWHGGHMVMSEHGSSACRVGLTLSCVRPATAACQPGQHRRPLERLGLPGGGAEEYRSLVAWSRHARRSSVRQHPSRTAQYTCITTRVCFCSNVASYGAKASVAC